jgi:O-antigen/teichoic acid export membrane protein
VASVVFIWVAARTLPETELGLLVAVTGLSGYLALVFAMGYPGYVAREFGKERALRHDYLLSSIFKSAILSFSKHSGMFIFLAVLVCGFWLWCVNNLPMVYRIYSIATSVVCGGLIAFTAVCFTAIRSSGAPTVATIVQYYLVPSIWIGILVALYMLGNSPQAAGVLVLAIVVTSLSALIALIITIKRLRWNRDPNHISVDLRNTWKQWLLSVVAYSEVGAPYLIGIYIWDGLEFASIGIALRIGSIPAAIMLAYTSFNTALIREVYISKGRGVAIRSLVKTQYVCVALVVPLALAGYIWGESILKLFSVTDPNALQYLRIILVGQVLLSSFGASIAYLGMTESLGLGLLLGGCGTFFLLSAMAISAIYSSVSVFLTVWCVFAVLKQALIYIAIRLPERRITGLPINVR